MKKYNIISIHFRFSSHLGIDYYNIFNKKAYTYIKEKVSNPFFYIFSPDISKVDISKVDISIFNDDEYLIIDENNYICIWIMSLCNHNIIEGSSTLGWWGAYMNKNKEKIVLYDKMHTYEYLKEFTPI